jgi:hypothetical protein
LTIKLALPWRRINRKFWWCSDVGSAVRLTEGWFASKSGYQEVLLSPNLGPFGTAREAMGAWEARWPEYKKIRDGKLSEDDSARNQGAGFVIEGYKRS